MALHPFQPWNPWRQNHPYPSDLTLTCNRISFSPPVPPSLLKKLISKHLEDLQLIAVTMIAGGIVMWIVDVDVLSPRRWEHQQRLRQPAK